MKRILCAIAASLLLCGCAGPAEKDERPAAPTATATEPSGTYEPGSDLEQATKGALRVYPQNTDDIWAIRAMGEDVLVFSGSTGKNLTRLSGENLFPAAQTELPIFLSADAPGLRIEQDRVIYYDNSSRELVYLDKDLQETQRVAMPEDMQGEPVLTEDHSKVYYCTGEGLRSLDMDTGISRLVKEMTFRNQYVEDLIMGDSIVRVAVLDNEGWTETLFLDSSTGALQGGASEGFVLSSGEDWFYATIPEGPVNQMIFGNREEMFQLHPADYRDSGFFLPESHSAVLYHWEGDIMTLDYYDLATGRKSGSLELGDQYPGSFAETETEMLYFLAYREPEMQMICRWDVSRSATEDDRSYVGSRYTMDAPDWAGLEECRQLAQRLEQRHGLEIRIGTDAVDVRPQDYDMVVEYQVPVIREALVQLEQILSHYPEGFFETALSDMEEGSLTVCLVRSLLGSPESGSLTEAQGIQYWVDNHSYVALALGENIQSTFNHEIFHVLEPRLFSQSSVCYRWDELNPKGFEYDYDYVANMYRDGEAYLEETTRSFIDTYSMSFPKEDRARVLEYACMPGNENYFISYTMQKKLRTLCQGIREAYGLADHPEALLWEQYLESPLHP